MRDEWLDEIRDGSTGALGAYVDGYFPQEQHDENTWQVVAPLVALLRTQCSIRPEILTELATLIPTRELDSLLPDSRGWKSGEGEDSERSVQAMKAALPEFVHALNDDDGRVRCAAAFVLSRLKPESEPALRARFAVELDGDVKNHLLLAIGEGLDDEDLSTVLNAKTPLDDDSVSAFQWLLARPDGAWLSFEKGSLARVAGRALAALGRDEPRSFELVRDAVLLHQARVDAAPAERLWSDWIRIDETDEDYAAGREVEGTGETLGQLEGLLAWLVLGDAPLRRDAMDERTRSVLPLIWGSVSGKTRVSVEAFLRTDSVLDAPLEVDGVTAPMSEHGDIAAVCRAALAQWPEAKSFELAVALLSGELPTIAWKDRETVRTLLAPVFTVERSTAFVKTVTVPFDAWKEDLAFMLVEPWRSKNEVPPPEFDVVIAGLMMHPRNVIDWLALFPMERRVALFTRLNADELKRYAAHYDKGALSRALWAAFMSPECQWQDHNAIQTLRFVDFEVIRDAQVSGGRVRVVNALRAEQGAVAEFTVTVMNDGVCVDGGPVMTVEAAAQQMRVQARRVVRLDGDVSHEREYAVFLKLGELLRPVTVIDRQGAELKNS